MLTVAQPLQRHHAIEGDRMRERHRHRRHTPVRHRRPECISIAIEGALFVPAYRLVMRARLFPYTAFTRAPNSASRATSAAGILPVRSGPAPASIERLALPCCCTHPSAHRHSSASCPHSDARTTAPGAAAYWPPPAASADTLRDPPHSSFQTEPCALRPDPAQIGELVERHIGKDHGVWLIRPQVLDDGVEVVCPPRTPRAIQPELLQRPVPCRKLLKLGQVVFVILCRIGIARLMPIPGDRYTPNRSPAFRADSLAIRTRSPFPPSHGLLLTRYGLRARPQRKTVMVFRDQHHVADSGRFAASIHWSVSTFWGLKTCGEAVPSPHSRSRNVFVPKRMMAPISRSCQSSCWGYGFTSVAFWARLEDGRSEINARRIRTEKRRKQASNTDSLLDRTRSANSSHFSFTPGFALSSERLLLASTTSTLLSVAASPPAHPTHRASTRQ